MRYFGQFIGGNEDPLWDPRFWAEPVRWKTITLSSDGEIFTVVDEDLHQWLIDQGPWHLYEYRGKKYAKRTRRKGEKGGAAIYMHRVIADRVLPPPKSKLHCLVDHKDSDGLNNRKKNLVRATPQQNSLNMFGMWWRTKDFIKELEDGEREENTRRKSSMVETSGDL